MKKVIALIGKGFSAQSIAQTVVTAFGTAKNVLVRIGAADPTGQQKIAIGPINGEANEEFLQDLLDATDGVVIAHFETLVGSPSVRGSIELELESSCTPDLHPYVAATEVVKKDFKVVTTAGPLLIAAESQEDAYAIAEKDGHRVMRGMEAEFVPTKTAPRQVTEPETQNRKGSVAQTVSLIVEAMGELGLGSATAILAKVIEETGGKVQQTVEFTDGSVLRNKDGKWEVA